MVCVSEESDKPPGATGRKKPNMKTNKKNTIAARAMRAARLAAKRGATDVIGHALAVAATLRGRTVDGRSMRGTSR